MDTRRVLFFLGILNNETEGHIDEIKEMYKKALDENDDVKELSALLNEYNFYSEIGKALHNDGAEILDKIYSMPSKSLEILPKLKQVRNSMVNAAHASDALMRSPYPFTETVTVLKNEYDYSEVLKMIASTCVYLLLLYSGAESVKTFMWYNTVGIREKIVAVNTRFLPALCNIRKLHQSWVIVKKHGGGKALFGGDCFYLNYTDQKEVDVFCDKYHTESISAHSFFNITAYESGTIDVPLCWGTGNIVSVLPDNALTLLQRDIVTKLRAPNTEELKIEVPTPLNCIKKLSKEGVAYCIAPEELLLAMNRWQTGHEIEERKVKHSCLFCGRQTENKNLVCPSHFKTEFR